ncbi:hypothetical protein [Roseibium salinum]|uniref:Uncharacterized protein n=1 Tax=Roseibium salinum TaxID=1604349 RepID=A0ABT3QZ45_9HYPH|nr:hypothetical protein [Roseibium sp. DSM 29163]MCX2722223.1 hypothetical protein [Roseibium sp. DSM 29163]
MNRTAQKNTFEISFLLAEASCLGDRAARALAPGKRGFALESSVIGNVITLQITDEEARKETALQGSRGDLPPGRRPAAKSARLEGGER